MFIGLVLGLPFGAATSAWAIFRDADTSWHVATGLWILQHGQIPRTDPFSFTAAGRPWVAMEWLADTIFALAYRSCGFSGLAALTGAALIATQAIIFFFLEKRVSALVIAATLLAMDFVLAPFMLARPHILAWPLIAGWTVLLLSHSEKGQVPPLWSVLMLVAWANLHASWPVSLAICGAIGLDTLIRTRWATWSEWARFVIASMVALSLNANGLAGLLQPFRTTSLAMLPLIGEWHRSKPQVTPFFFAVVAIVAAALLWKERRFLAGPLPWKNGRLVQTDLRLPFGKLLLMIVLLAMAIGHVRHQSLFIIVGACIVPTLWRTKSPGQPVPKWLLLCAVPMLAFRAASPMLLPDSEANPHDLIAKIPPELKPQPLFNGYMFGGPLILAGIRPYIDGRAEIYGDAFVLNYVSITNGNLAAFNRAVSRYGIRWAMIPNSDERLIHAIESSGEWRRLYSDAVGVIEIRVAASDSSGAASRSGGSVFARSA